MSQGLPAFTWRRLPFLLFFPAAFVAAGRFLPHGAYVWSAGRVTWCGQGGADHGTLGAEQGQREPSRLGSNQNFGISHRPTT